MYRNDKVLILGFNNNENLKYYSNNWYYILFLKW